MVRALVNHVPAMAPDLEFKLLTSRDLNAPLSSAPNVEEVQVLAGTNSPASMWLLPEIAPLEDCDLFHATANVLPARLTMPSVTTIHDIMWLTNPDWCDVSALGQIKRIHFANGIKRALASSRLIATVSNATREAIIAFSPELEDKITVARSGVSDRFHPVEPKPETLAQYGVTQGREFILVVGQEAPYKNHATILEAFAGAFGGGDALLVFVQRQNVSGQNLSAQAKALGISDQVRMTGSISDDDLLQLYSAATFLLHPSLCEGFGNPIAEAMACGCPVITSDTSAMPEVAGGAARLVDPHSAGAITRALVELWNDGRQRDELRKAGLGRAKELRWADFARANVEIYREALT